MRGVATLQIYLAGSADHWIAGRS
ncbi:hypothetical protein EMIT0P176_60134 [Pseudomonas sp. IT-P176]